MSGTKKKHNKPKSIDLYRIGLNSIPILITKVEPPAVMAPPAAAVDPPATMPATVSLDGGEIPVTPWQEAVAKSV